MLFIITVLACLTFLIIKGYVLITWKRVVVFGVLGWVVTQALLALEPTMTVLAHVNY